MASIHTAGPRCKESASDICRGSNLNPPPHPPFLFPPPPEALKCHTTRLQHFNQSSFSSLLEFINTPSLNRSLTQLHLPPRLEELQERGGAAWAMGGFFFCFFYFKGMAIQLRVRMKEKRVED